MALRARRLRSTFLSPHCAQMLPTIASGSSNRGKKNPGAAARAKAKLAAEAAGLPVSNAAVDPSRFALIPTEDAPKRKRKAGEFKLPTQLRDGAQLHLPHGAKFTQEKHLPASSVPGQAAIEALFTSKRRGAQTSDVFTAGVDMYYEDEGDHSAQVVLHDADPQRSSRHRRRRLQQHHNWTELLSSGVVELYLRYKHTQVDVAGQHDSATSCSCSRRTLHITLADWDGAFRCTMRAYSNTQYTCSEPRYSALGLQL